MFFSESRYLQLNDCLSDFYCLFVSVCLCVCILSMCTYLSVVCLCVCVRVCVGVSSIARNSKCFRFNTLSSVHLCLWCLSVCPSLSLSIRPSVRPSVRVCLCVCLGSQGAPSVPVSSPLSFVRLCLWVSVCLSVYMSVCLCVPRVARSSKCRCFKPSVFCCSMTIMKLFCRTYRMPQK